MNNVLTRRGAVVLRWLRRWYDRSFSGTEPALCQMSLLVTAMIVGLELNATYWPGLPSGVLFILGTLAILELVLFLARWILRRTLGHGLGWLMSLLALYYALARTVRRGAGEGWTWRVYFFAAVVAAALWLLTASFWSLLRHHRIRPTVLLSFLLGGAATAVIAVFLFTDGFDDHYIQRYLALAPQPPSTLAALEPSLGTGPYDVETIDYGPEEELEAGTVSLTRYMHRDTDELSGKYVDTYLDYSLSQVPLRGRVWYPAGGENCPVLFIAHGNHEITTESYLGYAYLGEYLASHGYVVVSVDQNACNMLSGENGLAIKVSGSYTNGNLVMAIEIPFNNMTIKVNFDGEKAGNGSVGGDDSESVEPDAPNTPALTADSIAGVYSGTMAVTLKEGTPAIEQEGRVEITAAGGDKLTLSLKNFKLLSDAASGTYMYVGNIELTDVAFTVEGGEAAFSVEQGIEITAGDEELPAGNSWIGPMLTATAGPDGIPVNIEGRYSEGAVNMSINIPFTAMQMNIKVEFNGTK